MIYSFLLYYGLILARFSIVILSDSIVLFPYYHLSYYINCNTVNISDANLSYYQSCIICSLLVIQSYFHTFILSYFHIIILSYCHTVILSYCHTAILSYRKNIRTSSQLSSFMLLSLISPLSYCHTQWSVIQSYFHTIILSYCHTFILSYRLS